MRRKKSEFMRWVNKKLEGDPDLAERVEAALAEMRVEQDLAALREEQGLTQTQLAARMGVSQPAVAQLESGHVKNLELRTLYRWAAALGARVTIDIRKPTYAHGQAGVSLKRR